MTPTSTYRLQINPAFDLTAAASTVDYLARLGVGAVYTSPLLTAAPGSTHGYDVVDPSAASPALGGEAARVSLMSAARRAGMGVVVDIVPNHMSTAAENRWWWDVLRHGPESAYAPYFDIDWSRGPILLPVLGSSSLADVKVVEDRLVYFEHEFPLAPGTGAGDVAEVHERQHYRLVWWRRGNAELTYRRFFDITTLAGVRVEDPTVFEATHGEVLRWVRDGDVTGLRVDHPDGLADPGAYMRRLREAAPGAWLVVEKILAVDESLPPSWPVDGTTGYDALRELCGVFVDAAGESRLLELAAELGLRPPEIQPTGQHRQDPASSAQTVDNPVDSAPFADTAVDSPADEPFSSVPPGTLETGGRRPAHPLHAVEEHCRRLITQTSLLAEMRRIARLIDVPPEAVAEIMIAFPVYRSYLPAGLDHWDAAVAAAKQARPGLAGHVDTVDRAVRAEPDGELATRIQQTSGMVVAKGVEDTAFYRWTPFVALNEVGGAPDRFGVTPDEFHVRAAAREAGWPATMTALSTHDTKRAEDVRARLAVLAEIPDDWAATVTRWSATHGIDEPSLNLLAWQTVVGAWPISPERLRDYLDKAAKEAKVRTSWVDHDEDFEAAVNAWPDRVVTELGDEIEAFVERIRGAGWSNSLGQKIVQLAGPGVPDVYQGTELFDLSLVDPDNRRPVDYALRRELLARLEDGWLPAVDDTGAAKLHVVRQALTLRRERPELFTGYRPLTAQGPAARHVLAFSRRPELVVVATRLPLSLDGWGDTVLPLGPGAWRDLLTGDDAAESLGEMLSRYPVALLLRGD
ncbi:malto-oligosyltrehalose synthase [Actinophytocola sp.]|uniref:malto-oligosyltrehalose synthase n=1 Tax=Actinophytocola sp. TaxID=1872138 RepID=UPI002D6F5A6E|nr:malto-oligosyltrehalose synthase [Actinophytocola sp.]HYQ69370.1 malto-oligosyltrehalose synthase [Actinophytocola sp.]